MIGTIITIVILFIIIYWFGFNVLDLIETEEANQATQFLSSIGQWIIDAVVYVWHEFIKPVGELVWNFVLKGWDIIQKGFS